MSHQMGESVGKINHDKDLVCDAKAMDSQERAQTHIF